MFTTDPVAVEALALRRILWSVYQGVPAEARDRVAGDLSRISSSAWRVFLNAERCGLSASERLRSAGFLVALPRESQDVLATVAMRERSRILVAYSRIRSAADITSQMGCTMVVLKGGLPVAMGEKRLDLGDVDVLVRESCARPLAEELDRIGYEPVGGSSSRHLATRLRGHMGIEIHVTLDAEGGDLSEDVWRGVVPAGDIPGVSRLSAVDHLWHVLVHGVADHPARRGQFRELVLLSSAIRDCQAGEIVGIRARAAGRRDSQALGQVLSQAQAIGQTGNDSNPTIPDAFERIALGRYVLAASGRRAILPQTVRQVRHQWVVAQFLDPRERHLLWRQVWRRKLEPSSQRWIAVVERASPRMGRLVRVSSGLLLKVMTYVLAVPIARAIRLQVR